MAFAFETSMPARLNKSGEYVLCGRRRCHIRFAIYNPSRGQRCYVLSGWHYDDRLGVWVASRHAERRVALGLQPADRRAFARTTLRRPIEPPARFRCPKCGTVSEVTAETLRRAASVGTL